MPVTIQSLERDVTETDTAPPTRASPGVMSGESVPASEEARIRAPSTSVRARAPSRREPTTILLASRFLREAPGLLACRRKRLQTGLPIPVRRKNFLARYPSRPTASRTDWCQSPEARL